MLRPSHGITNSASLVRSRGRSKRLADFQEYVARNTARLFHHLRRVAREMLFQNLEHTARMLQRIVSLELASASRSAAAILPMAAPGPSMPSFFPARVFIGRAFV